MHEAPGKPLKRVSFCELRALLSSPIAYTMLLENLLDRGASTEQPTRINDLLVCVLWV